MFKDILSDKEMREDILDYLKSNKLEVSLRKKIQDPKTIIDQLTNSDFDSLNMPMGYTTKSIIEFFGRPALIVKDDSFESPQSVVWSRELNERNNKSHIDNAIPAVGRIELRDPSSILNEDYYGTAWLIKEDIIVTNRHVAIYFVNHSQSGKWQFRQSIGSDDTIKAKIDFKEEYNNSSQNEFEIIEILDIPTDSEDGYPDVAFFRIKKTNNHNTSLSKPITLSESNIGVDSPIVVIGYPAEDRNRIKRQAITVGKELEALASLDRTFNRIYDVKRIQPGYIKSSNAKFITYDSTTSNKNSGSVVLDVNTGEAVGIHFDAMFQVHNIAIPSTVLIERLNHIN